MKRRNHQPAKRAHLDGLELARRAYSTGETKETTMPHETTPAQHAEQTGNAIALAGTGDTGEKL